MIDREALHNLSVADRLLLVEEIWDSIPPDNHALSLTDAQRRELDRRLQNLVNEPDAGISWDEVKARLRYRSLPGAFRPEAEEEAPRHLWWKRRL